MKKIMIKDGELHTVNYTNEKSRVNKTSAN